MPRKAPPPEQGKTEGRTAWHVLLAHLLQQRAPPSFRVLSEVPLGKHPPRLDLLLLRREGSDDDSGAAVLRDLWRRIRRLGLLEYKSPSRPLRRGELAKVLSYAFLYVADHPDEVRTREDLLVALVLPSLTPMLHSELAFFGWTLRRDERGYTQHCARLKFLEMGDEVRGRGRFEPIPPSPSRSPQPHPHDPFGGATSSFLVLPFPFLMRRLSFSPHELQQISYEQWVKEESLQASVVKDFGKFREKIDECLEKKFEKEKGRLRSRWTSTFQSFEGVRTLAA